ncbi:very long chain fatty acid elongase 4 isoform X2 [Hydra vulgaris]|uniref:Elongation of very long chain fatty acids protein n=1 Tax=Hydra vulgaris TaxID=6087 RepID=A0ABM4BF81_HYDVU
MDILNKIIDFYTYVDRINESSQVQDWPIVRSLYPTLSLCIFYLIFVCTFGLRIMKNFEPFQLKWILVVYNAFITVLNLHIFLELLLGMIDANYSWPCQPIRSTDDPKELRIASALWWYYISKLIEFLDTVFFVLRKKDSQLTFLHIYHHSTMPILWWIGIKWVPGGSSAHAAILNAFIHIIMYFYYGMAALGPQYQKYLWWKKYLTQMQLIQFTIALVMGCLIINMDCDFPRWMSWALVFYMSSFLILFSNFYIQAYIKRVSSKKKVT